MWCYIISYFLWFGRKKFPSVLRSWEITNLKWIYISGDFFKTAREAQYVNKKNLLHILAGRLTDFHLIHSRSATVHFPVEAQLPWTSMGLLRSEFKVNSKQFFFSASKLYGHWINAAIMSRPWKLNFSGGERRSGLAWTPDFCVMIGGSVERLHLLLIDSDFVAYYKKSPKLFSSVPSRILQL